MDNERALPKVGHDAPATGRSAEEVARFRRGTAKLSILVLGAYFGASAILHNSFGYATLFILTAITGWWIWTRKLHQ